MSVTSKRLGELMPGDFVTDMHDGLAAVREQFRVVAHHEWPTDWNDQQASFGFGYAYTNKHLIVLGEERQVWAGQPRIQIVCGYNYDGRRSGIVVLAERETGAGHAH